MGSIDKEADQLQYSLRSTFFYRKRVHFKTLLQDIRGIDSSLYNWTSYPELGISESSWKHIQAQEIPPVQIFCHPDVISAQPHLIMYYRSIAVLSQKGVQRLLFEIRSFENKKVGTLEKEKALVLARPLNNYISVLIDSDSNFSLEDALLVGVMNFGTQINGSWRNEIGVEGSRRIKELLLRYFEDHAIISDIRLKDGRSIQQLPLPFSVDTIQAFSVINGYQVVFGSEPDISIINPQNTLEVAIEVKAGIDPAGALERYGAAKKSFDRALRENKSATTIYLASCITEGVKKAMSDDRLVRREFNLTDIFVNETAKEKFLEYIKWLMHL
ncbi:MAG: XcyI family restriction endonuclease [candidate division KSB1 bacterium]|nr:XcyI family restriction endonuclease [candidate division KSB1 bacterium]